MVSGKPPIHAGVMADKDACDTMGRRLVYTAIATEPEMDKHMSWSCEPLATYTSSPKPW